MRKKSFEKALNKVMRGAIEDAILTALDTEEINEVIADLIRQDLDSGRCFLFFEKGVPHCLIGPSQHDAVVEAEIDLDSIKPIVDDVEDEDAEAAIAAIDLLINKLTEARTTLAKRSAA